jgi:A/G-specific adenine glycosylase
VTTSGTERLAPSAALRARLQGLPITRAFPWRETRDPWRVLVAELCCQQTQAQRAVAVYERCCARFPTPAACAAAPLGDVLDAWRGLGYYRRARALQGAATAIVDDHAGRVPDDLDALLALPGVGPYTARAVLCFAFERDVGIVDTNVARVLARAVANRPLAPREAQALADDLVPRGRGWAHNQAMLDLGATTCGPVPSCSLCPLRPCCRWRRSGDGAPDPASRTAFVSRPQPRFAGSNREGRGRLLVAALDRPLAASDLATAAGWPEDPARAARVAAQLVAEGLLEVEGGIWRPGRGARSA